MGNQAVEPKVSHVPRYAWGYSSSFSEPRAFTASRDDLAPSGRVRRRSVTRTPATGSVVATSKAQQSRNQHSMNRSHSCASTRLRVR